MIDPEVWEFPQRQLQWWWCRKEEIYAGGVDGQGPKKSWKNFWNEFSFISFVKKAHLWPLSMQYASENMYLSSSARIISDKYGIGITLHVLVRSLNVEIWREGCKYSLNRKYLSELKNIIYSYMIKTYYVVGSFFTLNQSSDLKNVLYVSRNI